jgi:hypothetical protein
MFDNMLGWMGMRFSLLFDDFQNTPALSISSSFAYHDLLQNGIFQMSFPRNASGRMVVLKVLQPTDGPVDKTARLRLDGGFGQF